MLSGKRVQFKKKNQHDSFRYPQGFKLDGNKVFLPKIDWMKFRKSQEIIGTPKNVTVSKRAGEWYISVQVEQEVEEPKHPKQYSNDIFMLRVPNPNVPPTTTTWRYKRV